MEIYAELFYDDKKNEFLKSIPPGVSIKRKGNSRACIFECSDELDRLALIEILEDHQVCFQDVN